MVPAVAGYSVHHSSSPARRNQARLGFTTRYAGQLEGKKNMRNSPKKPGTAQIQFDDSKREHIDNRFKGAVQIRGFVKNKTWQT